jgi:hypothetical protein
VQGVWHPDADAGSEALARSSHVGIVDATYPVWGGLGIETAPEERVRGAVRYVVVCEYDQRSVSVSNPVSTPRVAPLWLVDRS